MKGYEIREEKYKKFGFNDFRLKNVEDVANILDVYADEISGYDELDKEHKECFDKFIVNFFNGFGLEARTEIVPRRISVVNDVKDDAEVEELGDYLKFEYTRFYNGDSSDFWLHVMSSDRYY